MVIFEFAASESPCSISGTEIHIKVTASCYQIKKMHSF
jgi:hypothetical protein